MENETGLGRDPVSKAIINTDIGGYETYVQQRDRLLAEKQQLQKNTKDIETIKQEVTDIKMMLQNILQAVQK